MFVWFQDGKADVVANDAGDRVTPAIVAFTDHDQVSSGIFIASRSKHQTPRNILWRAYICVFKNRLSDFQRNRVLSEMPATLYATWKISWGWRLMMFSWKTSDRILLQRYGVPKTTVETSCETVLPCSGLICFLSGKRRKYLSQIVEKAGHPQYEVEYKEKTTTFSATGIATLIYRTMRGISSCFSFERGSWTCRIWPRQCERRRKHQRMCALNSQKGTLWTFGKKKIGLTTRHARLWCVSLFRYLTEVLCPRV